MTVHRKWLDAVSDNIANINTVKPTSENAFQADTSSPRRSTTDPATGGVQVGGVELGKHRGRMVYEPDHPLADGEGYVRYPDIDLGSQMTQLIMAQRGYQANLAVVDRAQASYQAALQLGRNA